MDGIRRDGGRGGRKSLGVRGMAGSNGKWRMGRKELKGKKREGRGNKGKFCAGVCVCG